MTDLASFSNQLKNSLLQIIGSDYESRITLALGELTLEIVTHEYLHIMQLLREHPDLKFEQLVDLCGLDYQDYGHGAWVGNRFAVVVHLLSVTHNQRIRVRVFCPVDEFPVVPSVSSIWSSANWYEREAFDLYGIVFEGHDDLRRILTDYGFIGHPFRKDFPLSGYVEMRYDVDRRRVVYEPVSIEPRENTPRIIREPQYGGLH